MSNPDIALPPRVNILGVGVSALNMPLTLLLIEQALQQKQKGYITVTEVRGIMAAQGDPALRKVFNNSFLTTPDGMPTVWLGRGQGRKEMSRVYGPDLLLAVCNASVERGYRHFFFGGDTGVVDELSAALCERFPGLVVVGVNTPPFRPMNDAEWSELKQQVADVKPDIFWVGLSTPKQDRFMAEHLDELDTTLMIGIGAAFDIHSGRKKEAPRWMMKCGLQWLQRLCTEPHRLARGYLVTIPAFLIKSFCQLAKLRKYPID